MKLTPETELKMLAEITCALLASGHFTRDGSEAGTHPYSFRNGDNKVTAVQEASDILDSVLDEAERRFESHAEAAEDYRFENSFEQKIALQQYEESTRRNPKTA